MLLAVLIICRKSILDPITPANGHTGHPDQEMQFLEEGHKIRTGFLKNAERIQKNADEI
jgi:hypothetical protein